MQWAAAAALWSTHVGVGWELVGTPEAAAAHYISSCVPCHHATHKGLLSMVVDGRGAGHGTDDPPGGTWAIHWLIPNRNNGVGPVPLAHIPGWSQSTGRGSHDGNHWSRLLPFPLVRNHCQDSNPTSFIYRTFCCTTNGKHGWSLHYESGLKSR